MAHAHAQSHLGADKTDLWHPCYSFRLCARAALTQTKKKRSLIEMGNLKQTELQRLKTEERMAEDKTR